MGAIRIFACLCVFYILRCGDATLITQRCPAAFVNGALAQMTCEVGKDSLSSCLAQPTNLVFTLMTEKMTRPTQLCQVDFDTTSCSGTVGEGQCGCIGDNSSTKTFMYNFMADKAQAGGKFECKVCASTSSFVPPPSNCDTVSFVTETTRSRTSSPRRIPAAPETTTSGNNPSGVTPTGGASHVKSSMLGIMGLAIIVLLLGWTSVLE